MVYRDFDVELDVTLAIEAYRMMFFELHPTAECLEKIWKPIDQGLQHLAQADPPKLTGFHSLAYMAEKDKPIQHVDIHVVGIENELLFLGTAATREAAIEDWWRQVKTTFDLKGTPPDNLAWFGARVLRRDLCGPVIPLDTEEITLSHLQGAARNALAHITPPLIHLPIEWVPDTTARALYEHLYGEARRTAQVQSEAERQQIVLGEYGPT